MKYLLLGYNSNSRKSDPTTLFIGDLDECRQEAANDKECLRFDFHEIQPPRFRKFINQDEPKGEADSEPKPAKKRAK